MDMQPGKSTPLSENDARNTVFTKSFQINEEKETVELAYGFTVRCYASFQRRRTLSMPILEPNRQSSIPSNSIEIYPS